MPICRAEGRPIRNIFPSISLLRRCLLYTSHKIYYKFEGNAPEYIKAELKECADIVDMLDAKMLSLNEAIREVEEEQNLSLIHIFGIR